MNFRNDFLPPKASRLKVALCLAYFEKWPLKIIVVREYGLDECSKAAREHGFLNEFEPIKI